MNEKLTPEQRVINIVLAEIEGTPSFEFVEIEDENGKSISVGEWVRDGDYWNIRISLTANTEAEDDGKYEYPIIGKCGGGGIDKPTTEPEDGCGRIMCHNKDCPDCYPVIEPEDELKECTHFECQYYQPYDENQITLRKYREWEEYKDGKAAWRKFPYWLQQEDK